MVIFMNEKVRQIYAPDSMWLKLNSIKTKVLKVITDIALGHICKLFSAQTAIPADEPLAITSIQESEHIDQAPPSTAPAVTRPVEHPIMDSVQEGEGKTTQLSSGLNSVVE